MTTPRDEIITGTWNTARRPPYRPTWVEIHLPSLRKNIRSLRTLVGRKTKILAVVKANAYGHAAVPLARAALEEGVSQVGVASIEEGITLRDEGITGQILILGSIFPLENLSVCAEYRLTPTISSARGLDELARCGARLKRRLPFHLKIDTGMGRIGISASTAEKIFEKILALRGTAALQGIYTHLSSADEDAEYTREQLKKFSEVIASARRQKLSFIAHAANSAATLNYPKSRLDMVRPGISLYGLLPFPGAGRTMAHSPVLSWKTRIVFLKRVPRGTCIGYCRQFVTRKTSLIATLPVGYADGYSRGLSNKAKVLINGIRFPVVGRVSMDMITVDVTGAKGISIGDEAVLIGTQGKDRITAEEMAQWMNTINYEITCGISYRVPRIINE